MPSFLCGGSHHEVSTVSIGWNKEGHDPPGDQRQLLTPLWPHSCKKKNPLRGNSVTLQPEEELQDGWMDGWTDFGERRVVSIALMDNNDDGAVQTMISISLLYLSS